MQGVVTWEMLIGVAGIVAGAFAVWRYVEARVDKSVVPLNAEIKTVKESLAAHKLYAAENYISNETHRASTEQVMTAIANVGAEVKGTNSRIDRLFTDLARRP